MGRVWVGWAGVVGVLLMLFIGLGFFGTPALQYGLPVIALTIGALLLPNGELWWKGLCLLGGVVIAMIGFLLGAGVFPDNAFGYTLGGIVPVTIVALATMWTKKLSYFLAGVFGVAAFQAVYTAFFFSDPQSINFSMPLAFGITLAPMALTFLVFTLLTIFVPRFARDGASTPAEAKASGTTTGVKTGTTTPKASTSKSAVPAAAAKKPAARTTSAAGTKAAVGEASSSAAANTSDDETTTQIGAQK